VLLLPAIGGKQVGIAWRIRAELGGCGDADGGRAALAKKTARGTGAGDGAGHRPTYQPQAGGW